MSQLLAYVRGLIVDANLATAAHPRVGAGLNTSRLRDLDHPTYLRRGIVIEGLAPVAARDPASPFTRA
ncbi:MAG: hypothetical protein WCY32_12395 [Burkholderiaceae bacterium]